MELSTVAYKCEWPVIYVSTKPFIKDKDEIPEPIDHKHKRTGAISVEEMNK